MSSIWAIITKSKNRQVLSWIGRGLAVLVVGGWAFVTYVWPAQHDGGNVACAQQGSIAAGRDASGNTITHNGGASSGVGSGTAACADTAKK